MFKVVILFCALGSPLADCDEHNAIDVVKTPERFVTPMGCLEQGPMTVARTALVDPAQVAIKITCPRIAPAR